MACAIKKVTFCNVLLVGSGLRDSFLYNLSLLSLEISLILVALKSIIMSVLEFKLDKIPVNFTKSILYILAMIPYHFIAFNLFKNTLPIQNLTFLGCACFCLSLSFLISNYFVATITSFVCSAIVKDFEYDESSIISGGGLIALAYISMAIFISYIFGFSFKYFIVTCYGLILLRIITDIVGAICKSKSKLIL